MVKLSKEAFLARMAKGKKEANKLRLQGKKSGIGILHAKKKSKGGGKKKDLISGVDYYKSFSDTFGIKKKSKKKK